MKINWAVLCVFVLCVLGGLAAPVWAQVKDVDRAAAYYHYSMGHLYGELAGTYGNRGEYLNQAIDHYRKAMKADPEATFMAEEISDLYIQSGRIREGVNEAEAALRENSSDLNARRILGRIYTRLLGDRQSGAVNQKMLESAIEQYKKIVEKEPKDTESWMALGRLHRVAQDSVEAEAAFKKALEIEPENEEAQMGLGMVYAALGDHQRASAAFKKVTDKNPNPRTLTALADSYEQMREYSLAAEALKKALELSRGNDEIKRALAQDLMLAERYDESIQLYEELASEDPKDVQSLLRLSQIYRQQRKYDKAREASDRAKKIEPNNPEVLYNEVGLFEAEGRTAEAIQTLKAVVDSTAKRNYSASEKNSRALLLERLGILYRSNEQFQESLAVFRDLGALDAGLGARSAAQVVDTLRQGREFSKAVEEAEAAYRKWPEDRTLRIVRATLLADVGRSEEAAADIRKLLNGKSDRETHLQLVQIHEKGRNWVEMGKAIDEAEKLSSSNEDKESIHFLRGAMFEKMKKPEQSEAEFRRLLALNPGSASALNYLGYMLADRNVRLNEALEMIQKAVDQEPHNGAFLDSLGWVYFRLGRLDEAETYLKKAVDRASKDPTVHDHLGDVHSKKGNLKDAITEWEASLRLWQASAPAEQDPSEVAKIQRKLEGGRVRLAREQKGKK